MKKNCNYKRKSRRNRNRRFRRTKRRSMKMRGGQPTLVSCGSGKCSTTGSTVVTYRGDDPVDSVPSFVSSEEAEKMYTDDQ